MKRGTAAKVILGKDALMDVPAGIVHGTDVILGGKAGLLNDFGGLVLSNNLMIGKKVSRGTITTITVRGQSPLVLPDAISGSLQAVKAFGGTEQRDIPDNYLQRQFIYMMEGSYLLTDIVPTYDGKVEMDFQTTSTVSQAVTYLGARTGSGYQGLRLAHVSNKVFRVYGFGSTADSTDVVADNTRYKFVWNNQRATLTSGNTTVLDKTFTNTGTITDYLAINGWNTDGTVSGNIEGIYLYSFKAWNAQGELVADYVPAVQKGTVPVVGFYDTVSGTFKTPTAGTFAAGSEAVPTPDTPMDIVSNNGVLKFGVLSTNLLDLANCTDGYCYTPAGEYTATPNARLSNYIPVKAGVTYTVGLTGEEGHSNVRINLFDTAKNWLSQTVFISYAGEKCTQSITPTQDGFLAFSANYLSSSRVDWNTAQVVQGSYTTETMPEYEPYRTGIYTDGTVETIVANSKNYLTRDGETTGQIINTDGTVSNNSNYNISAPFTLPAGDYTCTWTINAGNRPFSVFKCDANGNIILTADGGEVFYQSSSVSGVNTGNFTLDSTTLVRSSYRNNMTDLAIFSTSGTATAEMLLKVGDYQDEQEILSGSITRNIRVLVLDGTEGWTQTTISWGVYRYRFEPTGVPKKDGARGHCVSTHFFDIGGVTTQDIGGVFASTRFLYFIPDLTIDTVTKWTTYLADQYAAGTPVIVLYPLEEPTTESVTGQALQVQAGDNTVEITQASLDNLELEASYQTLVQLTIQEVEDANLNNNVEVTIS